MRTVSNIIGTVLLLSVLLSCYAHTGTPPGPTCAQDPSGPGCLGPLQDDKKKK